MFLKFITFSLMALSTLLLFWVLGWIWFAASVVTMEPEMPDQKTDAIIVLTGGQNRIDTGLNLLADKKAKRLFISGVDPRVKAEDLVALWKGTDKSVLCCLTLGYLAANTTANAEESLAWVKDNKIKSIRLVTSNYHMARSSMEFRQAMPDMEILKHPVTPDDFTPWKREFWPLTFQEYNKSLLTWLRLDILKNSLLNNAYAPSEEGAAPNTGKTP